MKLLKLKQRDLTDCGAACLAAVAAFHGVRLPVSRIRQHASTSKTGTNVLGLIEAAEKLGFTAKGVRGPFDSLFKIPKPAIAHVVTHETMHHFVVIHAADRQHIRVMDPADGEFHKLTHAQFQKQWTGVLVLIVPSGTLSRRDETTSPLRRFLHLAAPHRSVMAEAFTGALVTTVLSLATAIYVQKIVDQVLVAGNRNLLNLMSLLMLLVLAAQTLLGTLRDTLVLRTGQKIDAQLILGYYKHLLTMPQRFFDTTRVGEIISRLGDAVKIRAFLNDVSLGIVVDTLVVAFSFGLMFIYSWKIALAVMTAVPLYATVYWVLNRLNRKRQRRLMESAADLESQLVESLSSVTTIKSFGLERFANLKTELRFEKLLRSVYSSGLNNLGGNQATGFLSFLFTIILLWFGASLVLDQAITPGELMSCYALLGYITRPIDNLISVNKTIQDAFIAADRLFEIFDLESEARGAGRALTPTQMGDIRFERVTFRHGAESELFKELEFTLPRGRVTAIVGESGSGKSTLVSLLQRLYPINEGRIRIGLQDVRDLSLESLRERMGVVPQQVDIFSGSVLENIALGELQPDLDKVARICNELGIQEFIDRLPNGMQTWLGEGGVRLSGGEKQRIGIARALYKDPEILLLDEATSSLDSIAERQVLAAFEALRQRGKTIVMIAHRLSTIQSAGKIIVLHQGRVVEEGVHAELLEAGGVYARLWEAQAGGAARALYAESRWA